jgi:hypothetical protein
MENTIPDFMSNARLKLISIKGIGIVVARALEGLPSLRFKDIAISFAGDDLTYAEPSDDFKAFYGKLMPVTFRFVRTLFGGEADVRTARGTWILGGCGRMPEASPRNARLYQIHQRRSLGPQGMK